MSTAIAKWCKLYLNNRAVFLNFHQNETINWQTYSFSCDQFLCNEIIPIFQVYMIKLL